MGTTTTTDVLFFIFIVIWLIFVIFAYIKAWECTDKEYTEKSGMARQIGNLFIVPLLGPFWWIFYYIQKNQGYCSK